MFVVSLHGSSGQGVENATRQLAAAAVASGMHAYAYWSSEGRDVTGFVKIDKAPVLSRDRGEDDYSLVFSSDLKSALPGVRDKGMVIINTAEKVSSPQAKKKKIKVFALDASSFGPAAAQAMLGGFVKNFAKISLKAMKSVSQDQGVVEEGYKLVKASR